MTDFVFAQAATTDRPQWTRFRTTLPGGVAFVLDILVCPFYPHTAKELQAPYLVREGTGATATEYIPQESQRDFGMDIADFLVVQLGDAAEYPEWPHGLKADFTKTGRLLNAPDAEKYGMQTADVKKTDPSEVERRIWPMTKVGKYTLTQMFPGLEKHLLDFAKQIAAPAVTAERQEQDEANLGPSPSSESNSQDATAGGAT